MSAKERTFNRDLSYSIWHREESLSRFIDDASEMVMIDIDAVEVCYQCKHPIALFELQRSKNEPKYAGFTEKLARMAGIKAYSISYWTNETNDVTEFLVQRIAPTKSAVKAYSPQEFADCLLKLREDNDCREARRLAA